MRAVVSLKELAAHLDLSPTSLLLVLNDSPQEFKHDADLIDQYRKLLSERRVEGLIAVDTPCDEG